MKYLNCLFFAALLSSPSAFAGDGDWWNWVEPVTVKDIRVQSNRNTISFRTIEPIQNIKSSCADGYYEFSKDNMGSELLTMLMAAKVSGAKVGINIDATTCSPFGRVLVTQVRIL